MKFLLQQIVVAFFLPLAAFCENQPLTVLISKNDFRNYTEKDQLLNKAVEIAIGKPSNENQYTLVITRVDAMAEGGTGFEYYPSVSENEKKKNVHAFLLSSSSNALLTFTFTLDKQKSSLSKVQVPNLTDDFVFVLKVVVIGDPRIMPIKVASKTTLFNLVDEKSFAEKAFKTIFGENPNKSNYDIVFDNVTACLTKDVVKNNCEQKFDGKTYEQFKTKVTSREYSAGFILIDLHVLRDKSRLNQTVESLIIKDADGTEHLRFYFSVPRDNIRVTKKEVSLEGKIYSASKTPLGGVTIYLRDATNVVIATQTTDSKGAFKFEKIKEGAGYSLLIDNSCKEPSLFLYDKGDALVGQYQKTAIGFVYKLLDADVARLSSLEERDPSLEFTSAIKGKMLSVTDKINPISNQVIELKNSGNQVIQSQKTDGNGNFSFTKVDLKGDYSIELPNYTAVSKTEKVYLANAKNEFVKEFKRGANNKFSYKIVPADMHLLSTLDAEDPELTFTRQKGMNTKEIVINDFIYFNVNSFVISNESKATLDKIAKIVSQNPEYQLEIVSHTDSRGESADNLKLSEKRSAAVMNYFVGKNIDAKRLKSTGMGEAKPLNNCIDGVNCLEEEYKMNRRTEFRFYK